MSPSLRLLEDCDDDEIPDDGRRYRLGLVEALLGLPGFRVLKVTESDVELTVVIETTPSSVACTTCGVRAEPQTGCRST